MGLQECTNNEIELPIRKRPAQGADVLLHNNSAIHSDKVLGRKHECAEEGVRCFIENIGTNTRLENYA